jgi:tRNA nucleotidyltransferase (CCA-adding enzyme)
MLAKDIMTKQVTTVRSNITARELAKIFTKHNITGAPVVDKKGKVAGIVSDGDILTNKGKRVASFMTRQIISVAEDASVEEIANLMAAYKIKRVPVLNGEKLVGIVSRTDIVRAIAMGKHIAIHTPIYDL